ncbi:ABC-2 type transporter [Clostridiales bacterium oral taxon 876 str. F0540]|nr:ABC-2 type transporter [Clostridiales bacterium oral taxon 876 str. F0540]
MKVWAYILKDLRIIKKDFASSFLMLFIFPVMLSFFYGFFQNKMFQETAKVEKFTVSIKDNDNSESSKLIKDIFSNETLKDIIEIKGADGDIEVIIPKDFQNNLQNNETSNLIINQIKKDMGVQTHVVQGILDSFGKNISMASGVNKNIYASNLSESQKKDLIQSYADKLNTVFSTSAIKEDTLSINNRLNSIEYYGIEMLTFTSVLLIMSYSLEFIKERKEGTLKRVFSISIDGKSLFLGKIGALFIISTLSILSYVLFYRLTGRAFHGSIALILLAVIMNSLLIASITGLVISIFKDEKTARVVLTTVMMAGTMIGGVFFPIDIVDNKFLNIASKFTPNIWIAEMYKKIGLYNDFESMLPSLGVISAVVLLSFIIGSIRMNKSWEV